MFKIQGGTTNIANSFIDTYFNKAPYVYCLVYIYACRIIAGGESVTNENVANALRLPLSDVTSAWKYFASEGLIEYSENPFSVKIKEFVPIKRNTENRPVIIKSRPEYSPEEISVFSKTNENIKTLFSMAQGHLGKMLSQNDLSIILGIYDWLRLPLDVIEVLFVYCTDNNHYSLKYIEAVALDWAEKGIDTPNKASEYIQLHNKDYKDILRAMGIMGRTPTPTEEKFINKWIKDYNMTVDIIKVACEKTIMATGKPSFSYADKILSGWYSKSVKTRADIERIDNEYKQSKAVENSSPSPKPQVQQNTQPAPVKKNRFVNYTQRNWDFDRIRKLEQGYIDKQAKTNASSSVSVSDRDNKNE